MTDTPLSLLEQVKAKRDADDEFIVFEKITDKLTELHHTLMEVLQAKGLDEGAATRAAHELLQLDPEYTDLIGGTFSEADAEAMKQRLLGYIDASLLEELRESMRAQFEGVLKEIIAMDV